MRREVVDGMRTLMKLAKKKQSYGMLPICDEMIAKVRKYFLSLLFNVSGSDGHVCWRKWSWVDSSLGKKLLWGVGGICQEKNDNASDGSFIHNNFFYMQNWTRCDSANLKMNRFANHNSLKSNRICNLIRFCDSLALVLMVLPICFLLSAFHFLYQNHF